MIASPPTPSLSVFFPAYNDAGTIASLVISAVKTAATLTPDFEVLVINDGSTDDTAAILDELARVYPQHVRIIHHPVNRGYGGALRSGFAHARKDLVFYTDGDAQYDPAELAAFVAAASVDVDVVQGFKLGRSDNLARKVVGRVYHRFVKLAFGLRIRDTDCDFRLIRRSVLERVHLEHTSGVICVELVRKLQDAGARFVEVGVHHYPRLHGRSQFFKVSAVLRTLRDLAGLWWSLVVLRRGRTRPTR